MKYLSGLLCGAVLLSLPVRLTAETKSGEVTFTDDKKHVKLTVGEGVKFASDFYRFTFSDKTALAANGILKNTSGKKLYGALYIGFFDKDKNLVGCATRIFFLDPGKDLPTNYVIELPTEQLEKIASYQITLYESEKELGKK